MNQVLKVVLALLVVILVVALIAPFLVPIPPLQNTLPLEQLVDQDSRFVEIQGVRLHYKIMGQGEPYIVLLHGFGASLYSWQAVMQPLSRFGTVIAYDRPAFGFSERPLTWSGQSPYSPEAAVMQLQGLLDYFGIQQAILVGNSAGGTVAMNFSLSHPDRVRALVLVDPAVYEGGGAPSWVRFFAATPQMKRLGPLLVRSIQTRGMDLLKLAWHDPGKITPETLAQYTKPLQVENWDRALWLFTISSHDTGLPQRLGELVLPVLVITGDDDRIIPTEYSVRLAGELPQAKLVVIPNAGHVPHEEDPQAFLNAFQSFFGFNN